MELAASTALVPRYSAILDVSAESPSALGAGSVFGTTASDRWWQLVSCAPWVKQWKKGPLYSCLGYNIGIEILHSYLYIYTYILYIYGDYLINHEIRIPMKTTVFFLNSWLHWAFSMSSALAGRCSSGLVWVCQLRVGDTVQPASSQGWKFLTGFGGDQRLHQLRLVVFSPWFRRFSSQVLDFFH